MKLLRLKVKNFKCFEAAEVEFNRDTGFILLTGKNNKSPKLGANGTGKSTILDAICWALFERTAKGAKAGRLLQKGASGGYQVELEFDTGTLIRKWSPKGNSCTINGIEVKQADVDAFVRMSFEDFVLVSYFAQNEQHFFDKSPAKKLEFLSTVFHLDEWVDHSYNAKELIVKEKINLVSQEQQVKFRTKEIESLEAGRNTLLGLKKEWDSTETSTLAKLTASLESAKTESAKWIQEESLKKITLVGEMQSTLENLEGFEANRKIALLDLESRIEDQKTHMVEPDTTQLEAAEAMMSSALETQRKQIKDLNYRATSVAIQIKNSQVKLEDLIAQEKSASAKTDTTCPTCLQVVSGEHTHNLIKDLRCAMVLSSEYIAGVQDEETQLESQIKSQTDYLFTLEEENKKILAWRASIAGTVQAKKAIESVILGLMGQLKELNGRTNPFQAQLDRIRAQVDAPDSTNPYDGQIEQLQWSIDKREPNPYDDQIQKTEVSSLAATVSLQADQEAVLATEAKIALFEYWRSTGFPGIKLEVLHEAIQELDLCVNQAFSRVGLLDWEVRFSTESQLKSGSTKAELSIQVFNEGEEIDDDLLSGGERQRIKLAVALGISDLVKGRRGITWNMLMMDEPTMGLSDMGVMDLLDLLHQESESKLIMLAEHRMLESSYFDETWEMVKAKSGISELNRSTTLALQPV